jgi:rod shape-determining protein MreC
MTLFLKEKKSLIILVTLIIFQLLLISLQVPLGSEKNIFEKAVFAVFSPVQHGIVSFFRSIGGLWNSYFYFRDVHKQNQIMREELFFLRQENNILKNSLEKFRTDREIRDGLRALHENILPAQVVGFDASNFYKSMIINRSSLDGLKKDMVVLDRDGHLVGRTLGPLSLKEGRVQLMTDNESGVGVFSQASRVSGVLSGDGEGKCVLKFVLATLEISEGEEVLTSGKDGIFPSGILVGKIAAVLTDASLFKTIIVEPYFDIHRLDWVAVIKKNPVEIF